MDGRSKIDVPRPSPLAARMAYGLVGIHPNRVRGHLADRRRAGMAADRLPQLLAIDHGHESGSTSPTWRRHQRGSGGRRDQSDPGQWLARRIRNGGRPQFDHQHAQPMGTPHQRAARGTDLGVRPGARHGLYGRRYRRPVGTVVHPRQPDAASGAAGKVVSPLVSPYAPNPAEPNFRFHVVVPLPPTGTPLPWGSRFFSSRAPVSRHVSI